MLERVYCTDSLIVRSDALVCLVKDRLGLDKHEARHILRSSAMSWQQGIRLRAEMIMVQLADNGFTLQAAQLCCALSPAFGRRAVPAVELPVWRARLDHISELLSRNEGARPGFRTAVKVKLVNANTATGSEYEGTPLILPIGLGEAGAAVALGMHLPAEVFRWGENSGSGHPEGQAPPIALSNLGIWGLSTQIEDIPHITVASFDTTLLKAGIVVGGQALTAGGIVELNSFLKLGTDSPCVLIRVHI